MIIVAGSINLDLIARVQRLPKPGETVLGTQYMTAPGGKGANQALAASRAGGNVKMFGAVADDANAASALELLRAAGVDLSNVQTEAQGSTTGVAMILVDESIGENQIAVIAGANASLSSAFASNIEFSPEDFLLLQMEVPDQFSRTCLERATDAKAKSVLNIAPYSVAAEELVKSADYTIANETEFDALAESLGLNGGDRQEKAIQFSIETGKTLIITLGPDGAIGASGGKVTRVVAPQIEPIDTVGAGDTFCGAFAVALQEGKTLEGAMAFACKAGALACLKPGAQPSIPLRAEIDSF